MIAQEHSKDLRVVDKHWLADAVLRNAAGCWFFVTFIGQWLFMYYIVALFGISTVTGHFEDWTRKTTLFKGYVPGDTVGNLNFAAHVLAAAVVAFGGMLQLIPQIRGRAIAVHRWNGRVFLVAAVVASVVGLYMVWVRHATFGLLNSVAISLNAVLIFVFVAAAWRAARVGDIDGHRRWALRTFMVVNGVFFIRVAMAAWSAFAPGVATHAVYYFFEFASYLLPLGVLELYLRARTSASTIARFATAILLVAFTAYMTLGTFAAAVVRRAILG
jgi:uncharacterized membrane protein